MGGLWRSKRVPPDPQSLDQYGYNQVRSRTCMLLMLWCMEVCGADSNQHMPHLSWHIFARLRLCMCEAAVHELLAATQIV